MADRVLIVDDEPVHASCLSSILAIAGYDVTALEADEDPTAAIVDARPAIALIAMEYHGQSGHEICQNLRLRQELSGLRIVLMGTRARHVDVQKALGVGADAYVAKPFGRRTIVETVGAFLGTGPGAA